MWIKLLELTERLNMRKLLVYENNGSHKRILRIMMTYLPLHHLSIKGENMISLWTISHNSQRCGTSKTIIFDIDIMETKRIP